MIRLEQRLHKKQRVLEAVALQALEAEPDDWIDPAGIGDDMVVYKYVGDSLVAWVNTFPILNDDIRTAGMSPSYSFFSRNRLSQSPLANVGRNEQYLNIGSAWYVVRTYERFTVTVVTGILIKTDYQINNAFIHSAVNPDLKLPGYCSIETFENGFVVFGKDNGVLFSILSNVKEQKETLQVYMRWLSLCFFFAFLLFWYFRRPTLKKAVGCIAIIYVVRALCLMYVSYLQIDIPLFSPTLYADSVFKPNFASLIWAAVCGYLVCLIINYQRTHIARICEKHKRLGRPLFIALFLFIVVVLLLTVYVTLRSVIINSTIVMELYKLDEIDIYTFCSYFILLLWFISLFYCLRILWMLLCPAHFSCIERRRVLLLYLVLASLYTFFAVDYYGDRREVERAKVWTQKMTISRDLEFELALKRVDAFIAADPVLSMVVHTAQHNDVIVQRLSENYFSGYLGKYQMQVTICAPGDVLLAQNGKAPQSCYNFFHGEVLRHGIPLSDASHFYSVSNRFGNPEYIGIFSFFSVESGIHDLYIELEAKHVKDILGYPSLLIDKTRSDRFKLPYNYSYAKYIDGALVSNSGKITYPSQFTDTPPEGFSIVKRDRTFHYVYKVNETVVILSRPFSGFFPYFVSLSYLFLFFIFLSAGFPDVWRKRIKGVVLKKSFRNKLTFLLLGSLITALVFMAAGSIYYGLRIYQQNSQSQMQEKMQAALASLDDFFLYADKVNDPYLNYLELKGILEKLSTNIHLDITIYDTEGLLLRSSQPELFEKHLLSARMNNKAFYAVSKEGRKQFVQKEHIGSLNYMAMYAPLYNKSGRLIAYLNLPYFSGQTDMTKDVSSIVAAIVNLYLLLLIGTLLGGMVISNQLSRPLDEISRKMELLDITKKIEHIDYQSKDELGVLIKAYNKMVDDLEDSSRRLAQTEREKTWREMARQIAHEIKNPLTPMRLSIQHLVRLKRSGAPGWESRFDDLAVSLIEQIDILAAAASEFSNFSKFYMQKQMPIELNALIKEQLVLFNISDHIKIDFDSAVPEAVVFGRRSQLARVITNLLSNAVQALEKQSIGVILVSLRREDDLYVFSVADNGPGVSPESRHRLFTPDFTTKSSGTGLGLAISRTIVEQSQGQITYSTSQWGGACFTVRLPIFVS